MVQDRSSVIAPNNTCMQVREGGRGGGGEGEEEGREGRKE